MILCKTLGAVELTVDGAPAPPQLTWRKHLALLVYLARSPKLRRSREHLVGLLWPEKDEAAARHSLNEAIRVIRRSAGDGALVSEAAQVRLAADAVKVDVDQLEQLVATSDWLAAAELVGGEFLEGFSIPESSGFEDWLVAERRQWRGTALQVLLRGGEALLEGGQAEAAARLAERAWQLDFASETAAAFVMRGLALAGNRTAALERYDTFALRLRTEVGTEPGAELKTLAQRLREDRLHQPAPPRKAGERDSRSAPLVGRQRELRQLLHLWQRCVSGEGVTAAVILGGAGLGKTRLLEEVMCRARLDGASIAHGRAVESDRDEKWMGLRSLARGGMIDFPGVAGCPAEAHASIGRLAGEWLERFPGNSRSNEMALSQAVTEVLRVSADERPALLVTDDAQWMDRESLLAIGALLRDLKSSRLMLVMAASSQPPRQELESIAGGIGRDTSGGVFQLEPLGEEEMVELARWWLPRFNAAEIERVSRRVAADSAGLPLLAVEIFRAVALGMDLHQLAVWPQATRTLDHTLPADLPPSVVAAIRVAFRRLGNPAQSILATASVLPEPVSAERLARATGSGSAEVNSALDELEWHRWIVSEARGYSFVARLVRETIARDMLTEGQRRRIRTL